MSGLLNVFFCLLHSCHGTSHSTCPWYLWETVCTRTQLLTIIDIMSTRESGSRLISESCPSRHVLTTSQHHLPHGSGVCLVLKFPRYRTDDQKLCVYGCTSDWRLYSPLCGTLPPPSQPTSKNSFPKKQKLYRKFRFYSQAHEYYTPVLELSMSTHTPSHPVHSTQLMTTSVVLKLIVIRGPPGFGRTGNINVHPLDSDSNDTIIFCFNSRLSCTSYE